MKDRFDLEASIMECWNVTDDIGTFIKWVFDGAVAPSEDEQMNYLIGLQQIYQAKFSLLIEIYEQVVVGGPSHGLRTSLLQDDEQIREYREKFAQAVKAAFNETMDEQEKENE